MDKLNIHVKACSFFAFMFFMMSASSVFAANSIHIDMGESIQAQAGGAFKMLALLTAIAVTPAVLVSTTCFVRIIVVLSFLKNALGTQNTPPTQVITGLALFLTIAIMTPTANEIYANAVKPYSDNEIQAKEAFENGIAPMRTFMLNQVREDDLALFLDLMKVPVLEDSSQTPIAAVVPAFIISELRTSFEMGFLVYVPFLLIDFIVASVLMAMGMMMMPPAIVSLPIKIMLFVLTDGWNLIVSSLVRSFA